MAFALFLVYLAATFIRPFELWPDLAQFNPMALLGGGAFFIALMSRATGRAPLSRAPQLLLILVMVFWAAFSVLMTQRWLTGAVNTIISLSTSLFIFYLLVFSVDTLGRLRTTLHVLTLLLLIISLESISAYHFGYRAEELIVLEGAQREQSDSYALGSAGTRDVIPRVRHRGVLGDPNDLSQALIALTPFVWLARRPGAQLFNSLRVWLPTAVMMYTVFLTRSRGGVLALLTLLFLALRRRVPAVWSVLLTIVGATALLALGVFAGRSVGMDSSAESRTAAWRAGWEMLKSSPIWGIGFGYFLDNHERAAHNSLVQCFAEVGLVGYFLWLGTLVVTFWNLRQIELVAPTSEREAAIQRAANAATLSLASFLVAAFFLSRTYQPILFLLIGLATVIIDFAQRRRLPLRSLPVFAWARWVAAVEVASIAVVYVVMRVMP